mmetsp:Transcript_10762/g.20139  ORF Transcript_10762/g.20139 Transcript_10762/m.20139 type:complete len:914 (+) Transcript_10762:488-3229(+)
MSSDRSGSPHGASQESSEIKSERQPLKLKFTLSSLMGLKGNKKQSNQEETAADIAIDAHLQNSSSLEHDDQDSDENQNNSSSVNHGEGDEDMDAEEMEDASLPTDGDRDSSSMQYQNEQYASQDQYSQSETESNHNGKEEDHLGMSVDRDMNNYMANDSATEKRDLENDKDFQEDDDDEIKSEISRSRRTRSSSIDEQYHSKASAEDNGSSIALRSKKDGGDETITDNKSSRSAAAADRELLGYREPPTTVVPTTSFLDSLSEEQRRVRTRHLPDIAGFRRLHKSEIKRDLMLVKKMLKSSSSTSKSGKKNSSVDDEGINEMEGDKMDWDGNGASEDESQSDFENQNLSKNKSLSGIMSDTEILSSILDNPNLSNIFSVPFAESPYICTDVESTMASNGQSSLFSSPHIVESITAFNPPRPPESVGPKKIHRLNRWERNPQDIDVDLSNYKKTVERTRQELQKAEEERKRIEVVGQHLRTFYLNQLQCMSHEMNLLNDHYEVTQAKCIKAADLLTSKTRNRGVARGSSVIKDVLSVLKVRTDSASKDYSSGMPSCDNYSSVGVGGISFDGISGLASGWLLPGDNVSSPYGDGTVIDVFGPTLLNIPPLTDKEGQMQNSQKAEQHDIKGRCIILPPRISVKLAFGTGYFHPESLKSLQNVKVMKDDHLAKRWLSMIDSAKSVGTTIDSLGIDIYEKAAYSNGSPSPSVSDSCGVSDTVESIACDKVGPETGSRSSKLLQYGSCLLPTPANRGAGLESMSTEELEESVSEMLNNSEGILGTHKNPNVPSHYKSWERDRAELRTLQGKAMQLRNAVYRQRRIRFLNEKNIAVAQNRRDRFEALLSEMKSDLDILKDRLNEELNELGIDQSKAQKILSEYYQSGNNGPEADGVKRKMEGDECKSSRRKINEKVLSVQ